MYSFGLAILLSWCLLPAEAFFKQWTCSGCDSEEHRARVIGVVHRALYVEAPNVFYQINNGWVNQMLAFDARVSITVVKESELGDLKIDTLPPDPIPLNMQEPEVFKVIITEFPYLKGLKVEKPEYMGKHSIVIDQFLTFNPCWIPLHEPCAFNCTHGEKSYGMTAVLVHLPKKLSDTCKFFTALVKRQFPSECIYDEEHMRAVHPHNIGW